MRHKRGEECLFLYFAFFFFYFLSPPSLSYYRPVTRNQNTQTMAIVFCLHIATARSIVRYLRILCAQCLHSSGRNLFDMRQ